MLTIWKFGTLGKKSGMLMKSCLFFKNSFFTSCRILGLNGKGLELLNLLLCYSCFKIAFCFLLFYKTSVSAFPLLLAAFFQSLQN